jgi:hypothetical protein
MPANAARARTSISRIAVDDENDFSWRTDLPKTGTHRLLENVQRSSVYAQITSERLRGSRGN